MRRGRNPRRDYDRDGNEIEPMSLGNMREHGVRSVEATCDACQQRIVTRPAWTEHKAAGRGR